MATMLSSNSRPAAVPLQMASMVLSATGAISILPTSVRSPGKIGTINWLMSSAAGALRIDATRMWPATSGMTLRKMVA